MSVAQTRRSEHDKHSRVYHAVDVYKHRGGTAGAHVRPRDVVREVPVPVVGDGLVRRVVGHAAARDGS